MASPRKGPRRKSLLEDDDLVLLGRTETSGGDICERCGHVRDAHTEDRCTRDKCECEKFEGLEES